MISGLRLFRLRRALATLVETLFPFLIKKQNRTNKGYRFCFFNFMKPYAH